MIAVVTFVAGVIADALALRPLDSRAMLDDTRRQVIAVVRVWDRRATTPATLVVWAAGIALALTGGWFGQPWLTAKLVVVIVFSGVQGVQAGRLRRHGTANGVSGEDDRGVPPSVVVLLAAVAITLVILKPGHA